MKYVFYCNAIANTFELMENHGQKKNRRNAFFLLTNFKCFYLLVRHCGEQKKKQ